MDKPRAVITGDDLDTSRKCGFDFGESFLYTINHCECIHSVTHDDDATDNFALTVPFGNSFPNIGAKSDRPKITHKDRGTVLRCNWNAFEILERTQVTQTANHVPSARHFENATTNLICRIANAVNHHGKRNVVGPEFVGVQIHLILPNEPAH